MVVLKYALISSESDRLTDVEHTWWNKSNSWFHMRMLIFKINV